MMERACRGRYGRGLRWWCLLFLVAAVVVLLLLLVESEESGGEGVAAQEGEKRGKPNCPNSLFPIF